MVCAVPAAAGSVALQFPELRRGSYFSGFLKPRRHAAIVDRFLAAESRNSGDL